MHRGRIITGTVLVLALALTSGADAKQRRFAPVTQSDGALVFAPARIDAGGVRRAWLRLARDGEHGRNAVAASRVRRAVRGGRRLRLHRPPGTRRARLVVVIRPSVNLANCAFPHPSLRSHARADGCWRPYADSSPFNRLVPANAPVLSNSQQIVDRWLGFWDQNAPVFHGGTARTPYDYDHPIYYASRRQRRYRVRCMEWVSSCEVHGAKVSVPRRARPAGGSDRHMTVIDPASGREYDFWQVRRGRRNHVLRVGHGGIANLAGSGTGAAATAGGFALGAGVIRPQELAAGEIDHALFMVVKCTNGQAVAPAGTGTGRSCGSMGLPNANAPRMGEHFVLDMSDAEIDALPAAEWRKTILRAMARYGLYVGDTGGGMFKLQSGASWTSFGYTDPWKKLGSMLGVPAIRHGSRTVRRFDLRSAVDWRSRLKVVNPCVAQGSC